MTFGNYVLFNLLVAILVEGFQAEVTSCPAHLILPSVVPLPGAMAACLRLLLSLLLTVGAWEVLQAALPN
jgi:hypothetical protein